MENQAAGGAVTYENIPTSSTESNKHDRKETEQQDYQEALITVPPDGGWGWVVVFGAFFSFLIVDGMFYSFGVFLEKMSQDLNCSKSKVSLATAIITGVFCLSGNQCHLCSLNLIQFFIFIEYLIIAPQTVF